MAEAAVQATEMGLKKPVTSSNHAMPAVRGYRNYTLTGKCHERIE